MVPSEARPYLEKVTNILNLLAKLNRDLKSQYPDNRECHIPPLDFDSNLEALSEDFYMLTNFLDKIQGVKPGNSQFELANNLATDLQLQGKNSRTRLNENYEQLSNYLAKEVKKLTIGDRDLKGAITNLISSATAISTKITDVTSSRIISRERGTGHH